MNVIKFPVKNKGNFDRIDELFICVASLTAVLYQNKQLDIHQLQQMLQNWRQMTDGFGHHIPVNDQRPVTMYEQLLNSLDKPAT